MKCIAPVVPAWAERIEVQPLRANRLRVWGRGRSSYLLLPTKSSPPIQGFSSKSKKPLHVEFANLRSTEALVDYVRKYGPVDGKLEHKVRRRDRFGPTGEEDVCVIQDIAVLAREQQIFNCAIRILSLLQAHTLRTRELEHYISRVGSLYPRTSQAERRAAIKIMGPSIALHLADPSDVPHPRKPTADQRQRLRADEVRRRGILGRATRTAIAHDRIREYSQIFGQNVIGAGHGVLCTLFNRFPLEMMSSSIGGIELPKYDPAGILPILYFLLRQDYRNRRYLVKICPVCGDMFKPERGDSLCCSRLCYKKGNDRDRYLQEKVRLDAA